MIEMLEYDMSCVCTLNIVRVYDLFVYDYTG